MKNENDISEQIIGCVIEVHRILGPGLLESVYLKALEYELKEKGIDVVSEQMIPVLYKGNQIEQGFRADLVVEKKVIVELKSVAEVNKIHYKQLLTYLKLTDIRLGLLINFNVELLKEGIKRIAN